MVGSRPQGRRGLTAAWVDLVLRHRRAVVAVILGLSLLAAGLCSRAVIASTIGGLFLGESAEYERYLERSGRFASDESLVVAFEDPSLLTPDGLDRLERIVARLRALPDVGRADSVLDAQQVRSGDDGVVVERYVDAARADPARAEELLESLRADPLVGGLLVDRAGHASAVVVELAPDPDRPAERGATIVAEALAAFEAEGFPREALHRAGYLAVIAEVTRQAYLNMSRLFPVCLVVLLTTVWLLFRRLWPVFVTGLVALLGVLWTMGWAITLEREVSVMAGMVPGVVLIIAFSDVVHLCSAYLLELAAGKDKDEAIAASASEVGAACVLTSLTTSLGFLSMTFIPVPVFRHLGVVLGFGVAISLLLAVTVTPVLFSFMPTPKPWRRGATGKLQEGIDRVLEGCASVATLRPRAVALGFGAILLVSVVGTAAVRVETDFSARLTDDNPLRVDQDWLANRFAPANVLEVYVEVPEDEGLLDPETFAQVAALQDALEALPEVTQAFSLVDLMRTVHGVVGGAGAPAERGVPTTRGALAQYLLLFEMSGGGELERLVDFRRRTLRIALRLHSGRYREGAAVGRKARALGESLLAGRASVEPTGLLYLLGSFLDVILDGQRSGLAFAVLSITLMMVLGLRSLRVGLCSMVPNLLPLLALGGLLGFTWDTVDSDLLGVAMIAVGIGVDDTIHFLMRLRIEWARSRDAAEAVRATLRYSGRGIVMTTVVLGLGFLPFAASDYLSVYVMGQALPFCFAVALAADLLLVPALVRLGVISFGSPGGRP